MNDYILGALLLVLVAIFLALFLYLKVYRPMIDNEPWNTKFNGKSYRMNQYVEKALDLESPYAGRYTVSGAVADIKYWPTIDDPVMISLAESIMAVTKGWTELDRANFILRFVQQGTEYVLDKDRFDQWDPAGYSERWVFPVDTLKDRCGDCEDTSFLCAGLMHLCGLDVVTISLPGHICVGIHLEGVELGGRTYAKDGKTYYHVETIESHAIGEFTRDLGEPDFMEIPVIPDDYFRDKIRPKYEDS